MDQRRLAFGDLEVPYVYGADCPDDICHAVLAHLPTVDSLLLVVDHQVRAHAAPLIERLSRETRVEVYPMAAHERAKMMSSVERLLAFAVEHGITRRSAIAAMGGGLVGNVAGLAAALYCRGIPLVHLPTTPVAAFDSVISIKQAVNLPAGKNLCGTYYAPALIACDLRWLTSVPRPILRTGLAEMAKNVLITVPEMEGDFLGALGHLDGAPVDGLRTLLTIGIEAKRGYLRTDPHERGAAIVFEYGHTVGHAIEFTLGGSVTHGEAVAWGMLVAAEVSRLLGLLDGDAVDAHRRLVAPLDLPDPAARFPDRDWTALRQVLAADNKRGYAACGPDEVLMVLLEGVGRPYRSDLPRPLVAVPERVILSALDRVVGAAQAAGR